MNRDVTEEVAPNVSCALFTIHAHVLICISEDLDIRTRDISERVGVTQRATQRIIAELERAGYLRHERVGRRNRYELLLNAPLTHPIEAHISLGGLIDLLA